MNKVMIKVDNVSMKFNLMTEKISSIKEYLIQRLKGNVYFEEFWALKNISLKIRKGEVLGIIGLNGAGKSTLLKIISGVLKPSRGEVRVYGSIAPLIELGAGFDPELTAGENIYLNGAILGYSRKEMDKKFDSIIKFAELDEFVNVPIKNFSSGMYMRLGFAIATAVNPDILIVDEILSVGDIKFQEKCRNRIDKIIAEGATVILVSHSIEQIKDFCNRAAWLERGSLKMTGEPADLCRRYIAG